LAFENQVFGSDGGPMVFSYLLTTVGVAITLLVSTTPSFVHPKRTHME
jgi:hypothetical protein